MKHWGLTPAPALSYNDPTVTKQAEDKQMETFDDISCEEYYAIYDEQAEFKAWMEAQEAEELDRVNRELRELTAN